MKRGRLRLGVITSAKYLAPHLLGQFGRLYPGIDFSLKVTNRESLLERIANHEDDLYILGQPPQEIEVDVHPLVPNPLVVMASREHPLAGVPNIPLDRMLEESFILREPGSGTRDALFRLLAEKGLPTPMVRMELSSSESIKQAIVAGLGITVLSLHSLALEGTGGPIAVLDVQGFPIERHWYLAHSKGRKLSVVAQTFLDFVRQEGRHMAGDLGRKLSELRALRKAAPEAKDALTTQRNDGKPQAAADLDAPQHA